MADRFLILGKFFLDSKPTPSAVATIEYLHKIGMFLRFNGADINEQEISIEIEPTPNILNHLSRSGWFSPNKAGGMLPVMHLSEAGLTFYCIFPGGEADIHIPYHCIIGIHTFTASQLDAIAETATFSYDQDDSADA